MKIIKKRYILGTICILLLTALFHNVYDNFPNFITSLFFPVNESIWEHNKLILISYFLWGIIQWLIFKEDVKKLLKSTVLASIICIILVNVILTPIYLYVLKINDNFIVTIAIYIFSILSSFILIDKVTFFNIYHKKGLVSILVFIGMYILLAFLTYKPLKLPIFYDYIQEIYGIPPY